MKIIDIQANDQIKDKYKNIFNLMMFGGYTEVFAYGQDIEKGDGQILDSSSNNERYLSESKSQLFGGFKTWPDIREDFILLAECSETFGPVPIMTIPKKVENIDLNEFTVKLLSADYQGLGCGEGIPVRDTQLLKPDAMKDTHALINYFVLLDSQARGFVRPICIAYVTCDKHKLIQNTNLLQNAIIQAATAFKQNNRKLFLYELSNLLEDLEYTKSEYIGELPCEASCAKLELLESTQREVLQAYSSICHLEVDKKIEEACTKFSQHLKSLSYKNCLHFQILDVINQCDIPDKLYEPSIKKLPIYRNFESGLRPYVEICLNGFLLGIYQLYITYKFFRRKSENIISELKDKNHEEPVLLFGACLRLTSSDLKMRTSDISHNCDLIMPDIPHSLNISEMMQFMQVNIEFLNLFSDMDCRLCKIPNNPSFKSSSKYNSNKKENTLLSQQRSSDGKLKKTF
ncbi:guanine nucleotide exchange protein smcr8a-like isoform X1 [Centruroides sculpturatus]|uniref:guanine nucleotide exchange protein smcr8a-like isoform X1 n=2 Tax=Centruroides sculpturatus TaxID=218467 RepID=UPI000C6E130C|nr:guanine nucleotide exchange protein smcr8a-like isoform X1 [Centruroides sculpturatus]